MALAFKTIGRGFAPRNCFVFFTRPRRRRVSIYQSYISGLPPASAFSFSHVECIGLIKNRPIVLPIDQKP